MEAYSFHKERQCVACGIPAKLDACPGFTGWMAQAMRQAQPFHEACCIANRRDAVDMSSG